MKVNWPQGAWRWRHGRSRSPELTTRWARGASGPPTHKGVLKVVSESTAGPRKEKKTNLQLEVWPATRDATFKEMEETALQQDAAGDTPTGVPVPPHEGTRTRLQTGRENDVHVFTGCKEEEGEGATGGGGGGQENRRRWGEAGRRTEDCCCCL